MKFNIGDKVKFLNEKGEGTVTKLISSTMVGVSIEDGFEIPVMTNNLLVVKESGSKSVTEQDAFDGNETDNITNLREAASKKAAKGIYLGFVPHDQKWLITGIIDIYLINNSGDDILYNIFLKSDTNGLTGADYGSVPTNSKLLILSGDREELNTWLRGILQIMFHPTECENAPLPMHLPFRINPMKFLKEDNYKSSVFFNERALIYMLAEVSMSEPSKDTLPEQTIEIKSQSILSGIDTKEPPIINKHKIDEETAEVDLHIEELVKDSHILLPSQKLQIQRDYFQRCLDSAIVSRLKKVIFIHGVGQGVLKREIETFLHEMEGLEYYEASLSKYGVGATEVIIHYNLLK